MDEAMRSFVRELKQLAETVSEVTVEGHAIKQVFSIFLFILISTSRLEILRKAFFLNYLLFNTF